jgi:hypothetical protein
VPGAFFNWRGILPAAFRCGGRGAEEFRCRPDPFPGGFPCRISIEGRA